MRYVYIALFCLSLFVPLGLLEWLYGVTGSGLSIFDQRGAGQVSLYVVVLVWVLLFSARIAKDRPFETIGHYLREWRTGLIGLAVLFGFVWAVLLVAYLLFGLIGYVSISQEGWANFGWQPFERALVGLLVVFVLATTEEFIFRGFLMRYLRSDVSAGVTVAAVLVSSFIFAAVHRLHDLPSWLTAEYAPLFVGLFLLGVLLSVTYIATGSFWCAVGVHAGLLGSKVVLNKTHILDVSTGPWWLGETADLRRAPLVWGLFIALAIAVYLMRGWLHPRCVIENPVASLPRDGAMPASATPSSA